MSEQAIRLVASDLDGTLFGPDHVPEPRTVDAVNAVIDAGMIFVAVTGRSHFGGAARVTDSGARAHWFIGSNGGHRLNLSTKVLEERLLFSSQLLDQILTELPEALTELGFGFEHETGFTYDQAFTSAFPHGFDGGTRRDTTIRSIHDVGKIFVSHPDLTSDELINHTAAVLPDGPHVTTSGVRFVEITPAGADKAAGLSRLCDQLGVTADEVVAFGDNNNDMTMLSWAGRGIAMANATSEVIEIADEVTASNTDFGVAQVLEALT